MDIHQLRQWHRRTRLIVLRDRAGWRASYSWRTTPDPGPSPATTKGAGSDYGTGPTFRRHDQIYGVCQVASAEPIPQALNTSLNAEQWPRLSFARPPAHPKRWHLRNGSQRNTVINRRGLFFMLSLFFPSRSSSSCSSGGGSKGSSSSSCGCRIIPNAVTINHAIIYLLPRNYS